MVGRCHRPSAGAYPRHGAKGISVCEEWRNSFETFYDGAMANGYREGLSIDRVDGKGNYEPDNCRWITMKEQENNKKSNHRVEHNGETHTISEWADILGIPKNVLYHRFERGWTVEKTLSTPKRKYK
jgi:hypothetical protein